MFIQILLCSHHTFHMAKSLHSYGAHISSTPRSETAQRVLNWPRLLYFTLLLRQLSSFDQENAVMDGKANTDHGRDPLIVCSFPLRWSI